MKPYTIKIMGDLSLFERSTPIDAFDQPLKDLADLMTLAMNEEGGVGIAAPQIGINKRVIIFGFEENTRYPNEAPVPFTVLVNPQLEILTSETADAWEGCLSVPGLRGLVSRYTHIRYTGFDLEGHPIEREATGFHARIIQHEVDHLDGILFPMRIEDFRNFGFESALLNRPKKS